MLLLAFNSYSQTAKYFAASNEKCKNFKVFIDYRIQQYCGTAFTINWSGGCKDGFAEGKGILAIISKVKDRSFNMTYEGALSKGKKEGKGLLRLSHYFAEMAPNYVYRGSFKNDEFDGDGDFKSDYPYPVASEEIGNGLNMESYGLDMAIWRSDLFFYEYKGYFSNGKIADTENGIGKTKHIQPVGTKFEYSGVIKNGRPNGKGIANEVFLIAHLYDEFYLSMSGNFVNGRINGYGKQVGSYFEYEGEFVNGVREGKGKLTEYKYVSFTVQERMQNKELKNGRQISSIIDGNFKMGSANGFCTVYFQNEAAYKYTGPMVNGLMHGTGELEFLSGNKLRGNFYENSIEGRGVYQFNDGTLFDGVFKNNTAVTGILTYKDGSKYEGAVSEKEEKDKTGEKINVIIRQGNGTMTDKDGRKYNVTCENDNCKETK